MTKSDHGNLPQRMARDLGAGLSLLSRLPLPSPATLPVPPAVWCWPLVGGILAVLAALIAGAGLWLGLPAGAAAVLFLASGTVMTGAMHEDGLADTCDGFWGGWTRERRLEIMKDSHIGSYGVMALIFTALMRWVAFSALIAVGQWGALIAAAAISRAPMALLLAWLPNARGTGLSQSVGRPTIEAAGFAAGVATALALLLAGITALAMIATAAIVTCALAAIARRKIGGQTGDVLGASQQLAELAALAGAVAVLA